MSYWHSFANKQLAVLAERNDRIWPDDLNLLDKRFTLWRRRRPDLRGVLLNERDLTARQLLAQIAQVHSFNDDDAVRQEQAKLFLADIANLHQEPILKLDAFGNFCFLHPPLHVAGLIHIGRRQKAIRLVRAGPSGCFAVRQRHFRLSYTLGKRRWLGF